MLLYCIKTGKFDIAKILIEKGADINITTDDTGYNMLHLCALSNSVKFANYLMDFHMFIDSESAYSLTPLHVSCLANNFDMAKFLLDKGANPNARTLDRLTPLHYAARNNNVLIAELLIKSGAVLMEDENRLTPLDYAKNNKNKNQNIIQLFDETKQRNEGIEILNTKEYEDFIDFCNEDADRIKLFGGDFLIEAVKGSKLKIISFLIKNGVSPDSREPGSGNTALHVAAMNGLEEASFVLIQGGANLLENTNMQTALDVAKSETVKLMLRIKYYNEIVSPDVAFETIETKRMSLLLIILDSGFNINSKNPKGKTLLHHTTKLGDYDFVKILLLKNAVVGCETPNKLTPLHIAAARGYTDIVKEFVKYGAVLTKDKNGKTALDLAKNDEIRQILSDLQHSIGKISKCKSKEDFKQFIKKNKSIVVNNIIPFSFAAVKFQSSHALKYLFARGLRPSVQSQDGDMLLHCAASNNDIASLIIILENGAKINALDSQGAAALHYAAMKGNVEAVDLLLENGADPNLQTRGGMTPLMLAARMDQQNVISLLKHKDAKIDLKNNEGKTVIKFAKERHEHDFLKTLKKYYSPNQ